MSWRKYIDAILMDTIRVAFLFFLIFIMIDVIFGFNILAWLAKFGEG